MQEQFYKKVIESAPFGYAYYKIVLDENGVPADYEFINVNKAFEKLTGLKRKDIINKPVTDVLPNIRKGEFDWVSFYGEVALKGGEKIFEQYSKQLKKYYRVTVHSPEKYYFITIFTDISERKKAEQALKTQNEEYAALNEEYKKQNEELRNSKAQIAESREKFRTVADYTFDWEYWVNPQGKFIYVSPSCKRITGYSVNEFLQNPKLLTDIVHPDDVNLVENHKNKVFGSGEIELIEFRIITKSKEERWIGHICQAVYDSNGGYIGQRGSNRDITEHKKAEESLHESEKKYRLLAVNAVDFIFYMDLKLKFIYMSPSVYSSMGYCPEELIGTRLFKYTSRKEFIKMARLAIKTIINYKSNPEALFETKLINKNGQEVPVEISGRVVLNEKGKPIGLQGNIRDITKRKKAEEKLKDSEEQLRNFIKSVPVGLYRTTVDGKILLANPALVSMLNFDSMEELNNVNIEKGNLIQKNYRKLFKKRIDKNDNIIGYESKWKKKDGEEIFVRENARVFRDKNGAIKYYEGAVEDITERKKAAEQLKENEKRLKELNATKDKFFSIIAHDLRNPISNIVNFTELLSGNFIEYSDDDKEEIIKVINENSRHTFNLLQNLLEWSRSQTGQIEFSPVIFNPREVVDENINLMKSNADTKKVSLKSEVNPNHKAFADKNMINTVIRNLISNAIKFTKTGNVTISSEKEDDYIKISVIDTGVGIKKKDIDKLFKIEESISTKGTSGEKGTGLGLILCKEFVEKNNGKIWVESEIGKGSKFIFTIPQAN